MSIRNSGMWIGIVRLSLLGLPALADEIRLANGSDSTLLPGVDYAF